MGSMEPLAQHEAPVGLIGGSGLEAFVTDGERREVETPWGRPSGPIVLGRLGSTPVAFVSRHGPHHQIPPHRVPYRANLAALAGFGVHRVIASSAVGSLRRDIPPGSVVIPDQLVDRTANRERTIFDGPAVVHVSLADPYCPTLSAALAASAHRAGLDPVVGGTVVVIEGPRFSTRAESRWFRRMGWDLVNMTQLPEAVIARELGLCYGALALVTDYDTGVEEDASGEAVTAVVVAEVMAKAGSDARAVIEGALAEVAAEGQRGCSCADAVRAGRMDTPEDT
jgi:5'-methylthioadenosine phosphorylase